jgi:hypothetical protein
VDEPASDSNERIVIRPSAEQERSPILGSPLMVFLILQQQRNNNEEKTRNGILSRALVTWTLVIAPV